MAPQGSDGVTRAGAPNRKQLLALAKTLRKNATPYEKRLWADLRRLKPQGFHFRRQVVIGKYIVDFACHQSKTIIELDGNQHAELDHATRDSQRDTRLKSEGYHVLRFWNSDLFENYDNVLDDIYHNAKVRLELPA